MIKERKYHPKMIFYIFFNDDSSSILLQTDFHWIQNGGKDGRQINPMGHDLILGTSKFL